MGLITPYQENSTGVSNHEFAESKPYLCKNAARRIQRRHWKSTDDESGVGDDVADIRQSKAGGACNHNLVQGEFVLMPEVDNDG